MKLRGHRRARQHAVDLALLNASVGQCLLGGGGSEPQRAAARHLADWRQPDADDGNLSAQQILVADVGRSLGHGISYVAAAEAVCVSRASSSWRCTLPLVERGKSAKSMKWNCRGHL